MLKTGDPIHTAKHLISPAHVQSLGLTMASAGLCAQLGNMLDINMEPGIKTFAEHMQQQALQSTVDTLLTAAITTTSPDKLLSKSAQQIPLKAIAAYASNQICATYMAELGKQAGQALVGGLSGFAQEQTRNGFVSGATGALTAQTVGALLIADSQAIAKSAVAHLNKKGIQKTPENIQKAIAHEVQERMKLAKIAAASVAAITHQNPTIAASAATNAIDNDIAIRGQLAAIAEYQAMVTAASKSFITFSTHAEMFEADYQELQKSAQAERDEIEASNNPDGRKPFVKNPNSGIWFTACTGNDLVLAEGAAKAYYLFHRTRWHKHPKCPFTIFAHGDATSVSLENKNIHPEGLADHNMEELQAKGNVDLNAYELAQLIETAPDYKEGQHIHLFSCECGSEEEGMAQKLANVMKVPVSSFTGLASMNAIMFASVEKTSDSWIPKLKEIKTFYPRQRESTSTEISDRLIDYSIDFLD